MESSSAAGRRVRRFPLRPLMYTALACVAVAGVTAGGTVYVKAQAHSGGGTVSSAPMPSLSSAPAATTEEAAVAEPVVDLDERLSDAMKAVSVTGDEKVSAAVLDLESGDSAVYGDGAFDTASIVKVDILAALLLRHQEAGTRLSAREKAYATTMIENSDNTSASALWDIIGKASGLDAANKKFGLTGTEGGDGALWGLTQTTAADQLTLLQQVFGDDSELTETSRSYLQGLMGRIEADQQWGVSAAADGSGWALKNGWLPRSTTGLWDVNSIGRVTVDGHAYLVAVLSKGNSTQAKGISLVEAAAKAAVSVFTGEDAPASASANATSTAAAR
ncbi:class A beta-lactamase-related serine hydrolase [Streptomyces canus]|uniref:serine hydrolase n=1 Tax=Streptomyces canus TaxID=58343 RepID=UPI0022524B86|nr:serine hydrolase [Streptomyces canus]MCX5260648.1 class A beta-lactamase-related serine hydrolase [Streptomyces canus]